MRPRRPFLRSAAMLSACRVRPCVRTVSRRLKRRRQKLRCSALAPGRAHFGYGVLGSSFRLPVPSRSCPLPFTFFVRAAATAYAEAAPTQFPTIGGLWFLPGKPERKPPARGSSRASPQKLRPKHEEQRQQQEAARRGEFHPCGAPLEQLHQGLAAQSPDREHKDHHQRRDEGQVVSQ